jgi:cytochrome c2
MNLVNVNSAGTIANPVAERNTIFYADGKRVMKTCRRMAACDTAMRIAVNKNASVLIAITEFTDGSVKVFHYTDLMNQRKAAAKALIIPPMDSL